MSGFDKDWLALREPVDKAARDPELVAQLSSYLETVDQPRLMDIGCGTGSTWRTLSRELAQVKSWLLLDYDQNLLDEAERRICSRSEVQFRQQDLTDLSSLPVDGISVVTASALFDLCSEDFSSAFADLMAARSCGLYAALNYDGVMRWSIAHSLDQDVVEGFNNHQRTDKGFGVALGPDATSCLAKQFEQRGYRVTIGDSPWKMGPAEASLQEAFLNGVAQPLREIEHLTNAQIDDWLAFRLSVIEANGSLCEVGHADLLALPG